MDEVQKLIGSELCSWVLKDSSRIVIRGSFTLIYICVCVCNFIVRWARLVARMGEKKNAYRLLVGKPEGKRPLGRPRRRWVDNIRMDLGEVGWG
jgi:hypothetical protein